MDNVCLDCEKDYKAKLATSKFCSSVCRVRHHRRNKVVKKEGNITRFQMQSLYNSTKNLIDSFEDKLKKHGVISEPIKQKDEEVKGFVSVKEGDYTFHISTADPFKEVPLPSFQDLLNGMVSLTFSDEKDDYAEKIRVATNLTENQKKTLFTSLWAS